MAVSNVVSLAEAKRNRQQQQQMKLPHVAGKPKLVRRSKAATASGYTVDDAPASRSTWQFRIRKSGGKRSIVQRLFVSAEVRQLIREGNYELWKRDLINDFKASFRADQQTA